MLHSVFSSSRLYRTGCDAQVAWAEKGICFIGPWREREREQENAYAASKEPQEKWAQFWKTADFSEKNYPITLQERERERERACKHARLQP